MMTEPTTKPTAVPAMARNAVEPVPRALDRSTDSVPSTTQKPCSTSVISTTATARASPAAPRTAFRNHTDRSDRWDLSRGHSSCEASIPARPSRRLSTALAPDASRAASTTMVVAVPTLLMWKLGSRAEAMP